MYVYQYGESNVTKQNLLVKHASPRAENAMVIRQTRKHLQTFH